MGWEQPARWGMPAIPQSVPTQPGSSTHQEREIESIPIRPCERGPETGGLEAEPPGGRPGAVGWPCGSALHQRTGKLQFPVSGAGVPGSFFSWQEEATGSAVSRGQGRSRVGSGMRRSRPGQPGRPGAHTEVSGSAAEMVTAPSATRPPSWQVVGRYGGGKQPGFLSIWLQKPGIRFQGRLVGCEIETGVCPPVL